MIVPFPHHRRLLPFHLLLSAVLLQCTACGQDPRADQPTKASKAPIGLPTPVRTAGEDWPAFLGPRGDGSSSETGVDPKGWQPIPPVVWSIPLGVSYGAPTIAAGKLFQFDRYGDFERLTCYAAETGQELWQSQSEVRYDDRYGYNNGPRCSPLVDGKLIYLYGVTGNLSCVDSDNGQVVWSNDLNSDYGVVPNFFGVASNPCIFENLLLVMVGGSTPQTRGLPTERLDQVKPDGTAVVAFDKLTGNEVYRVGAGLASYASLVVKPIDGQSTGLAFLRDGLMGWEPSTGQVLFEFPWRAPMLESVNAALPVVSGEQILISEAYEVGSALLRRKHGHPLSVVWKDGGPRSRCRFRAHWSTPVVVDGFLYGCSGRNGPDTDFRCVRLADGEVMWTDRDRDRQRSSLLLVDGYLIVFGETGTLELIRPSPEKLEVLARADLSQIADPKSGEPLVDYPCWAAPVLSHGLLYLRGNRSLVCLDLIPVVENQ
ncbi:MAG: PQQ-binding-like beta-propeller repeat protein [Planctomycetales bacterium]|nr:PQQ-binding-like beta-propeller repeat protein [Planctomycetales bacterium]